MLYNELDIPYHIEINGNCIPILYDAENSEFYLYVSKLTNNREESVLCIKSFMEKFGITLVSCISEIDAPLYGAIGFKVRPCPETTECIYPIERFRSFSEVPSKRRLANQFFAAHPNYRCTEYSPTYESGCKMLLEMWEKQKTSSSKEAEYNAGIREDVVLEKKILSDMGIMTYSGFVLLAENAVIGFCFYEQLNENTVGLISIKTDMRYRGAYQALIHLLAAHPVMASVRFLNYGNLSGVPGLANMKMQWKPSELLKFYEAEL